MEAVFCNPTAEYSFIANTCSVKGLRAHFLSCCFSFVFFEHSKLVSSGNPEVKGHLFSGMKLQVARHPQQDVVCLCPFPEVGRDEEAGMSRGSGPLSLFPATCQMCPDLMGYD